MPVEEEYPILLINPNSRSGAIFHFPKLFQRYWRDPLEIYRACASGNLESVRFLLDQGVDINLRIHINVDSIITPLSESCVSGNIKLVRYLVQRGADVNGGNETSNPMIEASLSGYFEIFKFLLENGARLNTYHLIRACRKGHLEIVRFILERINMNAEDNKALKTAVMFNSLPIVEYILNHKRQLDLDQALEAFGERTDLGICVLLVERGARISKKCLELSIIYDRMDLGLYFLLNMVDFRTSNSDWMIKYATYQGPNQIDSNFIRPILEQYMNLI